jgi:glycogen debranching enzyme
VWPHDTALCAAGLFRYGLYDEGARLLEGLLRAAEAFEHHRLPELFCGFSRGEGPPVPYEKANVPQAWAAAMPLLAAQLFLGLSPDAPHRRCGLSPWLPEWLPSLRLEGIELGGGMLDIELIREGGQVRVVEAKHPTLEVRVETRPAPLWGAPG